MEDFLWKSLLENNPKHSVDKIAATLFKVVILNLSY